MGCMPCHYFSLCKSCKRLHFPNVGTFYSQRGNVLFPSWEYLRISTLKFCNLWKCRNVLGGVNTFRKVFDTSRTVKVKNNYRGTK